MSTQDLRRSTRPITPVSLQHCEICDKWISPWDAWGRSHEPENEQGVCPDCSRINDEALLQAMIDTGEVNTSMWCVCLCKCVDTDRQDDADFEMDSDESDDHTDTATHLNQQHEQMVTSRYGWRTNVVAGEGTDNERRIYYEGPGHFVAASTHDIGIPAESSRPNTDNWIGSAETSALPREIEPDEVAAMTQGMGHTWSDLQRIFPEMVQMRWEQPSIEDDTNDDNDTPRGPNFVCPSCNRTTTDGWMQWLRSGTMTFCTLCHKTVRPHLLADDPDWFEYNPSVDDGLAHCYCRCTCNVGPAGQNQQVQENIPVEIGPDMFTNNAGATHERLPLPFIPFIPNMDFPVNTHGIIDPDIFRVTISRAFDLPNLRVSQNTTGRTFVMECVALAIQDATVAYNSRSYDESLRYVQYAFQTGRYGADLTGQHPYMVALAEISADLDPHFETPVDNSGYLDDEMSDLESEGSQDDETEDGEIRG